MSQDDQLAEVLDDEAFENCDEAPLPALMEVPDQFQTFENDKLGGLCEDPLEQRVFLMSSEFEAPKIQTLRTIDFRVEVLDWKISRAKYSEFEVAELDDSLALSAVGEIEAGYFQRGHQGYGSLVVAQAEVEETAELFAVLAEVLRYHDGELCSEIL